MFNRIEPYAAVRTTELPWASTIPAHWDVQRAKAVMRPVDVRSESGDEELLTVSSHRGVVPRSSVSVSMFQAASYIGHKLCWPGDLVINSLWAWGRGLGVARQHGIVSTAYGVYRQRLEARILPAYLHHLVRSVPFQWELQVRSHGVWKSRLQITDSRFLDTPILLPPRADQLAIVTYLAYANSRIDSAIFTKRRLIALLEEQKAGTAAEVIGSSRGERLRLKHVATIQSGLTLGKDYRSQELVEYPYLRVANVQMGSVNTDDVATVAVPWREAERCTLRPNAT